MAAENKTVNGNYGTHQPYGHSDSYMASQGSNASMGSATVGASADDGSSARAAIPAETTGVTEGSKPPSKDEVGWYFVESYYTTLSKNPETLYVRKLFHAV